MAGGLMATVKAQFTATAAGFRNTIQQMARDSQNIGDSAEKGTSRAKQAFSSLGEVVKNVAGAYLAYKGVDALIETTINASEDLAKAQASLQKQTGATDEQMKGYSKSLQTIYSQNYGENFQDIADSMAQIENQTGLAGKALENTTKYALSLRDAFGMEVNESVRSANMLMQQFGVTSEQAYTLIAQGAQNGLDKNGDLLDTINEYSVQFKSMGFGAEDMFNILQTGAANGAWSIDKMGDAIKEFTLRSKDGSKTTVDGFTQLGLSADDMQAKFAKGGSTAREAFNQVVNALANVKDPMVQNTIGVELFGTQFEDLGIKAITSLTNIKGSADMTASTLGELDKQDYKTVGEALKGIGRNLQMAVVVPLTQKVQPAILNFIKSFPPIPQVVGSVVNQIKSFIDSMGPTIDNVKTIWSNLTPIFSAIAVAMLAALNLIRNALPPIVNAVSGVVAAFTSWGGFLPLIGGLGTAILTFKGIVAGVNIATKAWDATMKAVAITQRALRAATIAYGIAGGGLQGVMLAMRAAAVQLNIAFLANPIVLIIALIAGLVAALVIAYNKSETFRNAVNGVWDAIKGAFAASLDWLTNFFTVTIPTVWNSAMAFFQGIWNWLVAFFTQWGTVILAVIAPFIGIPLLIYQHWNQIQAWLVGIWNAIVAMVMPIIDAFIAWIVTAWTNFSTNIMTVINPLITFFQNTWENIKLLVLSVVGLFLDLLLGRFGDAKIALLGIWTAIKRQLEDTWNMIKDVGMAVFTILMSGLSTIWNTIKTTATSIWNAIKSTIVNLWNGLKSTVISVANGLKDGAVNAWNALKNGAINAAQSLYNGAIGLFNSLKSGATSAVNNTKSAITNGFNSAKTAAINAVTGLYNSVVSWLTQIPSKASSTAHNLVSSFSSINLYSIGRNIIQGLLNGITGMASSVWRKANEIADGITSRIKKALNIHSPSRVMAELGGYTGEGLIVGMDNMKKKVQDAAGKLASAIQTPISGSVISKAGTQVMESIQTIKHTFDFKNVPSHIDENALADAFAKLVGNPKVQKTVDRINYNNNSGARKPQGR